MQEPNSTEGGKDRREKQEGFVKLRREKERMRFAFSPTFIFAPSFSLFFVARTWKRKWKRDSAQPFLQKKKGGRNPRSYKRMRKKKATQLFSLSFFRSLARAQRSFCPSAHILTFKGRRKGGHLRSLQEGREWRNREGGRDLRKRRGGRKVFLFFFFFRRLLRSREIATTSLFILMAENKMEFCYYDFWVIERPFSLFVRLCLRQFRVACSKIDYALIELPVRQFSKIGPLFREEKGFKCILLLNLKEEEEVG